MAGFPHFVDHPTCSNCSNKVDELGFHKVKVSLDICPVETLVVFVLAEDELLHPALIITEISRVRIQIRFEHNNTEDTVFVLILAAREVPVLLTAGKAIGFFDRDFLGRSVCIKKTAVIDAGFL